jgi:hypothetical protein
MFAKYSDVIMERAIGAVAEEMSNDWWLPPEEPAPTPEAPTTNIPPPVPPIEERERQPRRRKQSNLRYLDERVHEGGVDWNERVAIARPGYKIVGIRHRTCAGHPGRFVVLTQKIRRGRRKANGGTNGK